VSSMTWNTKSPTVVNVKSELREKRKWLNMVRLFVPSSLPAYAACVIVSL
jgi:hypothetical protein